MWQGQQHSQTSEKSLLQHCGRGQQHKPNIIRGEPPSTLWQGQQHSKTSEKSLLQHCGRGQQHKPNIREEPPSTLWQGQQHKPNIKEEPPSTLWQGETAQAKHQRRASFNIVAGGNSTSQTSEKSLLQHCGRGQQHKPNIREEPPSTLWQGATAQAKHQRRASFNIVAGGNSTSQTSEKSLLQHCGRGNSTSQTSEESLLQHCGRGNSTAKHQRRASFNIVAGGNSISQTSEKSLLQHYGRGNNTSQTSKKSLLQHCGRGKQHKPNIREEPPSTLWQGATAQAK